MHAEQIAALHQQLDEALIDLRSWQRIILDALRRCYEGEIAARDFVTANHTFAKIAALSPSLLPICPVCRHTSLCTCSAPAPAPAIREEVMPA